MNVMASKFPHLSIPTWLVVTACLAACRAAPDDTVAPNALGAGGESSRPGGSQSASGAALCAACTTSADCGSLHDLCIVHATTKESFCGHQCSDISVCPIGFSCVQLSGAPSKQCVPDRGSCRPLPPGNESPPIGGSGGSGANTGSGGTGGASGSAGAPTGGTGGGGGTPADACGGECSVGQLTACTCGASDPCGWVGDNQCDDSCYGMFPYDHLDDSQDCGGATGGTGGGGAPCGGDCTAELVTACTCEMSDPCNWAGDGICDSVCYDNFPNNHFDDTQDCGSVTDDCNGDCATGHVTACSCGPSDPCGWSGDGYCDTECYNYFPYDHFDDWQDCGR